MNIFELSSCAGVVGGAAAGACLGYSWLGWAGAALGVPVGAAAGRFALPLLVFAGFVVGILLESGPSGVRAFFRCGRGPEGEGARRPPGAGH